MIDALPRIDGEAYVIAQLFFAAILTFGLIGYSYWETRRDMERTRARREREKAAAPAPREREAEDER